MMVLQQHFPNELAPFLLAVYNTWRRLGTIGVTSRTGISMIFYMKKMIKRIFQNYISIST